MKKKVLMTSEEKLLRVTCETSDDIFTGITDGKLEFVKRMLAKKANSCIA